ncbi:MULTISPECIES: hypothetical protein [unclassified Aminobacter]|uniref:hypothetical protein n=1 Tax=unclassified Aminobacter TaxID=2644704 RepID=UPI0004B14CDD|nr:MULTISPECIES: hypothetical protein [unclassified Aminobacter]TWH33493.1 hypothetical protein L611_000200000120 [Aminobacter sp. J15]
MLPGMVRKFIRGTVTGLVALAALPATSGAQSIIQSAPRGDVLIEQYIAEIGPRDLINSSGARLSQPWQVLRQDRANYHRFRIRDRLDEGDSFFHDANNRAAFESMLRSGSISRQAARDVMRGGAVVLVEIYGRGGVGRSVVVTVAR